jgi:hypothetical protein
MATSRDPVLDTRQAAGTIAQFAAVELGSGGTVTQCNAAGELVFGIAQHAAASGESVVIAVHGVTKIKLGATVATGARVATNASGLLITSVSTNLGCGICDEGGAVNEIGSCYFEQHGATP